MKKYSIIYADPPWAYRTYSKKGQGRSAESHYPTMCIEDIKALPVGETGDGLHLNEDGYKIWVKAIKKKI